MKISVEQYLADEERSQERHEYVAGHVYERVSGTLRHNQISGNIASTLHALFKGGACRAFIHDVRLRVEAADAYFYPDIFAVCSKQPLVDTANVVDQAQLVVEILSDSTSSYDRGDKMLAYRKLLSLKEYVLVWQDQRIVEVYRRADVGWTHLIFERDDVVKLESVNAELPVSTVYEDTDVA